ncbi:CRISPR-associated protein Csm1 [Bacteroides heparinolyticus]|uniref:CRISPR system single-strand-specific deoxyribonuclease Cas10/Csm1 (subtype III-A) n=1 Tax=Prevotella heparinolytica TaxID=28113 RepID=A0A4R2LP06_9BACE|nr:type III-A CRISPR-associated protein Cas10/Csm1 [Bacteroides heparinolyticus]TCO89136.1 CRISPR-associated protein Csm1 [Bacteroides heparinolyticus]
MDNVREKLYLAALLHDIGKFYQRADHGSVSKSMFLKGEYKSESPFCPMYNGRYTHRHVLWTAQFMDEYKSIFPQQDAKVLDELIHIAAGHHLLADRLSDLGKIIKEADCLSSGMDRTSGDGLKDVQDETDTSWDAFKKKRMVSILDTINADVIKKDWYHYPIDKMKLSKDYFPKKSFDSAPDYLRLWEEFTTEFTLIRASSYRALSETLLSLLLKYTSCIPSSTIDFADVSLYDHLKTTAALAVSLYDYNKAGSQEESPFLLIGADFSGIQSYIYQIVSKYAGKNLKGRSFYLRLLSDTVVRYLLKELDLFQANIMYNSGGSFYLLAPNTEFVKEKLKQAVLNIEQKLFETHGTTLFVAIDSVEVSKEILMRKSGSLGDVWAELFDRRDKKKATKFAAQAIASYDQLFTPSHKGGNAQRDTITGEEFLDGEKMVRKEDLLLKPINAKQIELGAKLRDFDIMVVKEGTPLDFWDNKLHITPLDLDFTYYFLKEQDLADKSKYLKNTDLLSVVTMNGKDGDCIFMKPVDGINNIVYGLDFYGGNETDGTKFSTFEEMCDNSDKFSRLGVLRMDVDNLGSIFQRGLLPEKTSLSRYVALSRSFDFFFSGYLNTLWQETDPKKSFIVYSGGDDVFIVGSWDVTILLAEKINEDFKKFACDNPIFSLSAGIAFISPKFPIMKGADESDREENNAKKHTCAEWEKNSISFMQTPLNWDKEYGVVARLKTEMVGLLKKGEMPKSFLSKIMSHCANAKIKGHRITVPKTYWLLTYDLSRMKMRSTEAVKAMIEQCINEVCNKKGATLNGEHIITDYHPLELWNFAARWAELEYRS